MRLFDAHCHLQDERLAAREDAVLAAAREAGVEAMLCCGSDEGDWDGVESLAARRPEVIPAYGLHPWFVAGRSPDWFAVLRRRLVAQPAAAVGEIGLDRALAERRDDEQVDVFRAQWRLARDLGRPACVHVRRAWEPLLKTLREEGAPPAGFLIHSYSGSAELVPELAGFGAFFSFSGSITRSGHTRGHQAVRAVPDDRLLIETDAPDLTPIRDGKAPAPGEANEPANLAYVCRAVASLLGRSPEEIARLTWDNGRRLAVTT